MTSSERARRTTVTASAPGKLIVAGEYAVLRGSPAIVLAVDRRAVAREVDDPEPLSPFLAEVAARLGRDAGAIRVDTAAFASGGRKLGLGSSAAATVAFAGALAPDLDRPTLHGLAHRAHGDVSARGGARGSGVDVAAAIWGGAIRATPAGDDRAPPAVEPVALPADLWWVAVDSGAPADTRALVARVMAAGGPAVDRALDAIATACAELGAATRAGEVVAAVDSGRAAIAALADATGVALITPAIAEIANLAARSGGAAKPTGAAGGDVVFAVFTSEAAAGRFRDDLAAAGMAPLALALDPYGLLQNPD